MEQITNIETERTDVNDLLILYFDTKSSVQLCGIGRIVISHCIYAANIRSIWLGEYFVNQNLLIERGVKRFFRFKFQAFSTQDHSTGIVISDRRRVDGVTILPLEEPGRKVT